MPVKADWTWLVFMAGDNNLEGAGADDLKEMRQVGSSDRLHVLVQFDTERSGTTRYRVQKGRLAKLQHMPGVNSGDPKVLTEFISWGMQKYPASHYLIDVWNHGGGWEDLPANFDYESLRSPKPAVARKLKRLKRALFRTTIERIYKRSAKGTSMSPRAIAIDTGSHDYLDNQELQGAVANTLPADGKFDILGCDACLMNMIEICYEMRSTANFMVGSEETEPGAGWPYAQVLRALAQKPNMDARSLASTIVESYGAWYVKNGDPVHDASATQSALDMSRLGNVIDALNELAEALRSQLPEVKGAIALAKTAVQKFDYPEYIDLRDFATQLSGNLPAGSSSKIAADKLQQLLTVGGSSAFVLANATWGDAVQRASGVSIYFPEKTGYSPDYDDLDLSKDGSWAKMLKAFFAAL
jgi:hypothetical protein